MANAMPAAVSTYSASVRARAINSSVSGPGRYAAITPLPRLAISLRYFHATMSSRTCEWKHDSRSAAEICSVSSSWPVG
ncbi:hypothetical protein ATO49_12785 [Mycolicibacterium fortuitum subsp. fortuitum DSM 46621 = ATCC 6841 = JCM 6387]|nr:hypothetical protein ATO49_12785 [Mycolicibacterium fortuitum subsp. fortuitum DSM 46621 = ATCC 6841 = JCM 6387]